MPLLFTIKRVAVEDMSMTVMPLGWVAVTGAIRVTQTPGDPNRRLGMMTRWILIHQWTRVIIAMGTPTCMIRVSFVRTQEHDHL